MIWSSDQYRKNAMLAFRILTSRLENLSEYVVNKGQRWILSSIEAEKSPREDWITRTEFYDALRYRTIHPGGHHEAARVGTSLKARTHRQPLCFRMLWINSFLQRRIRSQKCQTQDKVLVGGDPADPPAEPALQRSRATKAWDPSSVKDSFTVGNRSCSLWHVVPDSTIPVTQTW